jgi:hypothetical protein
VPSVIADEDGEDELDVPTESVESILDRVSEEKDNLAGIEKKKDLLQERDRLVREALQKLK